MLSNLELHKRSLSFILVTCLFYVSFGYDLLREDTPKLIGLAVACFFFTHKIIQWEGENFKLLFVTGLVFRVLLFGATPILSQDFYRYIWDGQLLISGINPYLFTPNELIDTLKDQMPSAPFLYEKMGDMSQKHYSNYPPTSQFIYALAAYIGKGSVTASIVVFKVIITVADVAVLFFSRWLMQHLKIPKKNAFWYFLNPLVILELSGNLHLEGVMIAFFLAGICWLIKAANLLKEVADINDLDSSMNLLAIERTTALNKITSKKNTSTYLLAALLLALSIMTKLIPILFYPFLLIPLGFKKWLQLGLCILLFCGLLLWPLLGEGFFEYYLQTIGLWFSNFEFNASIYNIVKNISKTLGNSGYKTILSYGKWLPFLIISWAIIVLIWQIFLFKKEKTNWLSLIKNTLTLIYKKPFKVFFIKPTKLFLLNPGTKNSLIAYYYSLYAMLFMLSGYLFLATTIHPWYLIFGLVLSLFTPYRYFIYWTAAVFLSYATYAHPDFKENLWLIAIEYLGVFTLMIYEIVKIKTSKIIYVKNV